MKKILFLVALFASIFVNAQTDGPSCLKLKATTILFTSKNGLIQKGKYDTSGYFYINFASYAPAVDSFFVKNPDGRVSVRDVASLPFLTTNFYNSNGTLTGNRIVTGGDHTLTFNGTSNFTVTPTASGNDQGNLTLSSTDYRYGLYKSLGATFFGLQLGSYQSNPISVLSGGLKITSSSGTGGFTFPVADGTANQVLKTDGSGNVTWATPASTTTLQQAHTNSQVLTSTNAVTGAGTLGYSMQFGTANTIPSTTFSMGASGDGVALRSFHASYQSGFFGNSTQTNIYWANANATTEARMVFLFNGSSNWRAITGGVTKQLTIDATASYLFKASNGVADLYNFPDAAPTVGQMLQASDGSGTLTFTTVYLSGSGTLDFPSTSTLTSEDLTITVTGAAVGDPVTVGAPNGSVLSNSCYTAWVSATNTVTVRFNNYSIGSQDPASGTFKIRVFK